MAEASGRLLDHHDERPVSQNTVVGLGDPMQMTLEAIIVNGLNQEYKKKPISRVSPESDRRRRSRDQHSPGDSDYESAHEVTPAKKAKTATMLPILEGESLDQKIERSIKCFFEEDLV